MADLIERLLNAARGEDGLASNVPNTLLREAAAALEAAREDAERYRYLRDVWGRQIQVVGTPDCTFGVSTPSWRGPWPDLDAAIDQARGKENGNG